MKCHYVEYIRITTQGDSWSCRLFGVFKDISDYLVSEIGSLLYQAVGQYADCETWFKSGYTTSGVYEITFNGKQREVYCEMDAMNNEGWTVIQKRVDGSVDFTRGWADYKNGFGNVDGEYWLGNDDLHALTTPGHQGTILLKIFAKAFDGEETFVVFSGFKIENETINYKLHTGKFVAGESSHSASFLYHDGMYFSAPGTDNDPSWLDCAVHDGFWYNGCQEMSPNGPYYQENESCPASNGMMWYSFKTTNVCLKEFQMSIRMVKSSCDDWFRSGYTKNGVYEIT